MIRHAQRGYEARIDRWEGRRISLDLQTRGTRGDIAADPLRVAIYVHCFYPQHFHGTEAYARALGRAMIALGHRATIVTTTPPGDPPQATPIERYAVDGVPVIRIDKSEKPGTQPELMRPVQSEILDELDPDVIHVAHLRNHSTAVLALAQERGIPVFATLTDAFGICPRTTLETAYGAICAGPSPSRINCLTCAMAARWDRPGRRRRWNETPAVRIPVAWFSIRLRRLLSRELRKWVTSVIERPESMRGALSAYRTAFTPTHWLAESYRTRGFDFPVVVTPFGTDVERRPKPARDGGPLRLGFVGQIAAHKGLHLVIEALGALFDEVGAGSPSKSAARQDPRGLHLQVWGSEAQEPGYAATIREAARGLPVAFRGTFRPGETADVFAGIDVLVMPSTWRENSPLTLLAALATHTPVIVSDVAGMTDLIEEGRNGLAFRRGDARDLAEKIRRFLDRPGLAAELSRQTAYARTERDMAQDVLRTYRQHGVGPKVRAS